MILILVSKGNVLESNFWYLVMLSAPSSDCSLIAPNLIHELVVAPSMMYRPNPIGDLH